MQNIDMLTTEYVDTLIVRKDNGNREWLNDALRKACRLGADEAKKNIVVPMETLLCLKLAEARSRILEKFQEAQREDGNAQGEQYSWSIDAEKAEEIVRLVISESMGLKPFPINQNENRTSGSISGIGQ